MLYTEGDFVVDDRDIYAYALCYPQIRHPLYAEKKELKQKYVGLLEHYANQYCNVDPVVKIRIKSFCMVLLGDVNEKIIDYADIKTMISKVFKVRFKPFRLFSYRYLFIFDCLFILAPDNPMLGERISCSLKSAVHSRYHKRIDLMVKQMYANDDAYANKRLITSEMSRAWSDAQAYIKSRNRNIMFTATISAGKSTLINAIIGQSLSYAKKAACTATVMKFISAPTLRHSSSVFSTNEKNFFLRFDEVREMTKKQEAPCDVVCYFHSLLSKRKITLIDTPGVNSVRNPGHKKITRKELSEECTDLLVYVIPVENYGSEDDYIHLSYIRKNVRYNHILFVVNMMDTCDFEDDSVKEIVSSIQEHLTDIGYESPIICPMSAKAGMLMKQVLAGNDLSGNDKEACENFVRIFLCEDLALGKYYPENLAITIDEMNALQRIGTAIEKLKSAYINTGLPGFEKLLFDLLKEEKQNDESDY